MTCLVAGNMIGSGVYLLPAALATIGSCSIISWIIATIGVLSLALVFIRMANFLPKSGGPYAYVYATFGDFLGYQTAFTYWVGIFVGNLAIALSATAYGANIFPYLATPHGITIANLVIIWLLTLLNIVNVQVFALFQNIISLIKFVPLFLIATLGWFFFKPSYLHNSFNLTQLSDYKAVLAAIPLVFWSFIGIESATVPTTLIRNPKRTIPLATILGLALTAFIYIGTSVVIMGMVPLEVLSHSSAPFSRAAGIIFGRWGEDFISISAIICSLGCLNGWILLQGQIPFAAAKDGSFPAIFAKCNRAGIPVTGIVITSILMSLLLILIQSFDLVKQFEILILIASVFTLIPYFYTAIASLILERQNQTKQKISPEKHFANILLALLSGFFVIATISATDKNIIYYVLVIILISVFFYPLALNSQKPAKEK